jgi:hypothetical protein
MAESFLSSISKYPSKCCLYWLLIVLSVTFFPSHCHPFAWSPLCLWWTLTTAPLVVPLHGVSLHAPVARSFQDNLSLPLRGFTLLLERSPCFYGVNFLAFQPCIHSPICSSPDKLNQYVHDITCSPETKSGTKVYMERDCIKLLPLTMM